MEIISDFIKNLWDWIATLNNLIGDLGVFGILIGAFIGWGVNLKIHKSRIQADLKAATRLEWIKEVRQLTSEIVSLHHDFIFHRDQMVKYNTGGDTKRYKSERKRIRKIYLELIKKRNLYHLYFSNITEEKGEEKGEEKDKVNEEGYYKNHRNEKMRNYINKYVMSVRNCLTVRGDEKTVRNSITVFIDKTSNYLKIEWDRAKNNE